MPGLSKRVAAFFLLALAFLLLPAQGYSQMNNFQPPAHQIVYTVTPSATDPQIRDFNEPSYVIFNRTTDNRAQLVIFLPGTKGTPRDTPFFTLIANQGYRVINLEYNDVPAVNNVCPRDPDPDCASLFRQDRIYGGHISSHVSTPPPETIMNRLVKVLDYLDRQHPQEQWGRYLVNGEPDWSRIVVSGLSQGAGMAAYIAKQKPVARAVLFSSPWDYTGREQRPAPWLHAPSATPMNRWYAAYHEREKAAAHLMAAYGALGIPDDHIFAFNLDLPPGAMARGNNPFHPSTIRNEGYASQWQMMFGRSSG